MQVRERRCARVLGRRQSLWKGRVCGTSLHIEPEVVLLARSARRMERETQYRVGPFDLDESKNVLTDSKVWAQVRASRSRGGSSSKEKLCSDC